MAGELAECLDELTATGYGRINAAYRAAREAAQLAWEEDKLESERHGLKAEAIERIMVSQSLPITRAEKLVETDPAYMEFLTTLRNLTARKALAFAKAESLRMHAKLLLALAPGLVALAQQDQGPPVPLPPVAPLSEPPAPPATEPVPEAVDA